MVENKIVGKWILKDGKIIGDKNNQLIEQMIENELVEISRKDGGWTVLYKSSIDNNYWELTFPQSELHGGGPKTLERLSFEDISTKYGNIL